MYKDEEIEFRVFDYGYKHALTSRGGSDVLHFPEPQIIFLYNGETLPDEKIITLDFGQQGTFDYHVPVFKLIEYSPQELSKMQMIILIPFAILKLRKEIEKNHSIKSMNALKSLIFNDTMSASEPEQAQPIHGERRMTIMNSCEATSSALARIHDILKLINENQTVGNITAADSRRLKDMIQKLYQHLYAQYEEFERGRIATCVHEHVAMRNANARFTRRIKCHDGRWTRIRNGYP